MDTSSYFSHSLPAANVEPRWLLTALTMCALVLASSSALRAQTVGDMAPAYVELEVLGLRSDRGSLSAGLFDGPVRWLDAGAETASCRAAIHGHRARCVFGPLRPGRYAVAFFHDEDGDGAVGRDWLGIPTEGYGFSNDAAIALAPPSFSSARFDVRAHARLRATARYGL
jgi:uncharacterized protein (DUF2141 family)